MKREEADKLTLQEAVDFAVLKMVEQGGQCRDGYFEGAGCLYGDGVGKHCGVGWLLDEEDEELMSWGGDVSDLCDRCGVVLPSLIYTYQGTLLLLQAVHDADNVTSLLNRMEQLSNSLDTSAPQYQQWVELRTKQLNEDIGEEL